MTTTGIAIAGGTIASVAQIKKVTKALMKVLNSPNDQETKREAIAFLRKGLVTDSPSNMAFTNVNLDMDNSVDDSIKVYKNGVEEE